MTSAEQQENSRQQAVALTSKPPSIKRQQILRNLEPELSGDGSLLLRASWIITLEDLMLYKTYYGAA